uniref:Neprosin PEP catalytic domain-containing protein n=1 Tax=Manihot esculenta TaxID=3983 RepID=A0A2C9U9V6_MANES
MEKRNSKLLLLMAVSVLSTRVHCEAGGEKTEEEINMKLKLFNKPAVKTIKSEDGDIIDCVDIYKQPAFDHPALKNHTLQMRPSSDVLTETSTTAKNKTYEVVQAFQTWQKSGTCPNGTIPIRRIHREDLLRAASLDQFGRKYPNSRNQTATQDPNAHLGKKAVSVVSLPNRSSAVLFAYAYNFIGASGDINVWNPHVQAQGEYTTAQIWAKAGPGDTFESVEAGWVVHPALFGDTRTRLFAYWTVDGYRNTGCFDLTCTGFVQTSSEIALGLAIEPISSFQYQTVINVYMFLDVTTGSWWLHVNNKPVGYWPGKLFSFLTYSAIAVEWGGDVYSQNVRKTPHTMTAMGSGYAAEELFGLACFINNVRIVDFSKSPKYPNPVNVFADEYRCYSAINYIEGNGVEPVFFFGGPGQTYTCP